MRFAERWALAAAIAAAVGALTCLRDDPAPPARAATVQPALRSASKADLPPPAQAEVVVEARRSGALDDPGLRASLAALAAQAAAPRLDAVLAAARPGGPVDVQVALQNHLRRHPEHARFLIPALEREVDPRVALQQARALAPFLGDPTLRAAAVAMIAGLRDDPARQAVAAIALLGRREADATGALLELFVDGQTDHVRGRGATLLAMVAVDLDAETRDRARALAAAAVADADAGVDLLCGAAALLGQPDASGQERRLLRSRLDRATTAAELTSLAQAWALTGADGEALAAALAARADDPRLEPEARQLCARSLATLAAAR